MAVTTVATGRRAARSDPAGPGLRLYRRTFWRLSLTIPLACFDGAALVFFYLGWVLPAATATPAHTDWKSANLVVFVIYMIASFTAGAWWCGTWLRHSLRWLVEERPPDAAEVRRALGLPMHETLITGIGWAGAAIVFPLVNLQYSGRWAEDIAFTTVLAGLSNCALVYLLAERILRPVFAEALSTAGPDRPSCLQVAPRMLLTWAFCTGIPVLGLGLAYLGHNSRQLKQMVGPLEFLVAVALVTGIAGTYIATRSVADPLTSVRRAMARVEQGDIEVSVRVYDGSEIGALQAGFNRMVAGLRERRQLQDLFGRHVGEEVARRATERGVQLGGETLTVALFFVDVCGSTAIAASRPATEVVSILNRFFGVVVDVVNRHGGWVNKFEGDAALCVFGAPLPCDSPETAALQAARELRRRLAAMGEVDVGIGVSSGEVVAGNIGAESRFEYTVIGDPVNEAARLTELAKTTPGRVVTASATVRAAAAPEGAHWSNPEWVEVRGRDRPVEVAHVATGRTAAPQPSR